MIMPTPVIIAGEVMVGEFVRSCAAPLAASVAFARPKVEHLHVAIVRQPDVSGLQIAMDDPLLMRRVEGVGHLLRDRERLVERERAARQPVREGFAVDQFEDEELLAVRFVETVDRANVRMVQRREHLGFTAEPGKAFGVVREAVRQQFQRDIATKLRVSSAIDLAHPARPEG
jgi:hypothetical protein